MILTNTGAVALVFGAIQISGTNASDYSENDNCLPQVQATKSCLISVAYNPSATGNSTASVVITDNASGSPQQITLTGTGTTPAPPPAAAPAVTLNPNTMNFTGTITEGTLSAAQNLVLTNSGNATLHVQAVVLGGTNSADFTINTNGCVGALAVNNSCVVSLTFAPSATGVRTATLTVSDDAANSPQTLNLLGTGGIVAQIGVVGNGSTSASISAGQSAQFNLQLLPGAGFSGTLALTCTGAPVAATCSIPASVAMSNGAAEAFTVTVSTTGASAAPPVPIQLPRTPLALPGVYAVLLLLLICFRTHQKESSNLNSGAAWSWRSAGISMVLLLLTLAGCGAGGGSGGRGSNSTTQTTTVVTPSGTYTIVVPPTAIASGTSKQFQLSPVSLTVTVK